MSRSDWSPFELIPDDVLFFRDGKPSTRGTDHYLRSLFPPYPPTLYGAIRTRRLADEGIDLSGLRNHNWPEHLAGELGPWGGFGSLALRGPWLVHHGEPLLAAPLDLGLLLESDPPKIATVVRFLPDLQAKTRWSHPVARLVPCEWKEKSWRRWASPGPGTEPSSAAGWYLKPAGIEAWRRGETPAAADFVAASDLWQVEARTGVGLQSALRSSEQGLLYTFGFIRLRRGVGLGFEVSGSGLQAGGRVRLGGEGRTAILQTGRALPVGKLAAEGDLIAVSFATPALSSGGSYPPGFSDSQLDGVVEGHRLRLVGAVVPGYVPIGGWDLANSRPKPLRRAIPAGSVYFFQLREANGAAATATALHGLRLTDAGDDLDRQGFGLVVAGVCTGGSLGNENVL